MAVIESADRPSLFDDTGQFSVNQSIEILQQICEALHHTYKYGISYQNLTRASILISESSDVRLRGLLDEFSDDDVWYSAPEEFNETTTERTLVYRIGIIAYELLTGVHPYESYQDADPEVVIKSGTIIPPSERISTLSSGIDDLILKALATSPEVRHETVLHLRDELSGVASKE